MSEMDTEPPPAEDGNKSDPAFSAFLTKQLCMHGGRLLIADIPNLVGLTPEHIAGILHEEEKRFPEPELGTVMVQSPVRLCSGYLGNKCQATDCGRLHLCRYFILGHCFIRGDRHGRFCKFSHDIRTEGNRAVLKANEIRNLNEKELRVLLQLNDPSCLPQVCYDYKGGKNDTPCPKGEECSRLHICQHFAKGQCRYFRCNRSHNFLDDITMELMKGRGLSEEMINNIQILRIHQCNEARKEPWKDEWPKGNKDHTRSCGDRINERRESRPQTPDTDGSEVQDVVERTSSESNVSLAEYKSSAPSSRNRRRKTRRPKSASPLPHPTNTVTTYPSAEFLPTTQPTNNSDAQTSLTSPTKSNTAIPTAVPRTMDLDVEKLLGLYMKGYKTLKRGSTVELPFKEMKKPKIPTKPLSAVPTTGTSNPAITFGTGIPLSAKHDARLSVISPSQVTTAVKLNPFATASDRADPTNKGDIHISVSSPSTLKTSDVSLPGVMTKTGTQPTNKSPMPTSVDAFPPKAKVMKDLDTASGINMSDNSKPPTKASVDAPPSPLMCTKQPAPSTAVSPPLVRPVVSPEDCGDPNEICFYHIWAFCQRKSACPWMHYHLPYRWQIEKAPGVWEDLPWMEDIEKVYSDPDNTSSGRHDVNFERMISSYHQVRRLSTASSVTQPPDHLMTTEWVWHWKNEHGMWIEYGQHGGKKKSTIASTDLETIYLADKTAVVPFQAGSQRYQINFKDMIQQNLIYETEKEVRRRPRFVPKEDVDKLKPSTRSRGTANKPASSAKGIPGYWDSTAVPDVGYRLVEISKHSMEFTEIEKSFKKTMPQYSIQKAQRIQNITLWNFYQMQKDAMKKQNNKEVLEKQLFHGTETIYLDGICRNNFDWRVCGLNGTVYGKGSYFARDASYSHKYCNSNSTSITMFLARVLVGDFANGDASYKHPPSRPGTKNTFYDSCVDTFQDPSIFVIFDKPQIYPEYIIKYTENKSCCIC